MLKIAVILSGCGHKDGAEIHESVFTLLALSKQGVEVTIFAPNRPQYHTLNHYQDEECTTNRNILEESARIARGDIKALTECNSDNFDALILPGGFGALKNFTNYPAEDGIWEVNKDIKEIILAFHTQKKPIGAICIFPSILAILFKDEPIVVTTGLNPESKKLIDFTKAHVELIDSDEIVVDPLHLFVSTPAFMNGESSLHKTYCGIEKLTTKIIELSGE